MFPECCKEDGWWPFARHVDPQHRCLVDSKGKWVVDFIGRTEKLQEDMDSLIELINERRPANVQRLSRIDLSHTKARPGKIDDRH